jgi:hypothetical protein
MVAPNLLAHVRRRVVSDLRRYGDTWFIVPFLV